MAHIMKYVFGTTPMAPQSPPPPDHSAPLILPELPAFEAMGIKGQPERHIELMKGRALTVIVGSGEESQAFVLPYLLLRYYSDILPLLVEHEEKSDQLLLRLPDDLPAVFGLVANWIHTENYNLPIAEDLGSTGRKDRVEVCKLLCRTWLVVDKLHIDLLKASVLQDLRNILQHTRNMGFVTPITPGTIFGVFDRIGTENRLWELLMKEMSAAFTRKPRPLFAKYQGCFEEIEAFRSTVSAAMAEAVCKVVYDKQEEAVNFGSEKTDSTLKEDHFETEKEHLEMSEEEYFETVTPKRILGTYF